MSKRDTALIQFILILCEYSKLNRKFEFTKLIQSMHDNKNFKIEFGIMGQ